MTPDLAKLDQISISDLKLRCIIGIFPEERREKQDIVINLTMYADLSKAGKSDDIADTVDYKSVKKKIIAAVERSSYALIERLATAVADICLEDPKVRAALVRIDKPGALRFAKSVSVQICRKRPPSAR